MTTDERIEALVKASEEQRISIEKLETTVTKQAESVDKISKGLEDILAGFREFKEDHWHINRSLRILTENVDRLTANVNKLETLFTRSLTKPPNGKPKRGEKK